MKEKKEHDDDDDDNDNDECNVGCVCCYWTNISCKMEELKKKNEKEVVIPQWEIICESYLYWTTVTNSLIIILQITLFNLLSCKLISV